MCLVAIKPQKTAPLESGNLVVEQPALEIKAFSSNIQFPSDCKANEIYNSELSLCMPARPPKKNKRPLPSLSLVKESNQPLEIKSFSSSSQSSSDCRKNEIWVPEIGTCVSLNSKPPIESASLIRNPSSATKPDTAKDCGPGDIFVSEIGLCQSANPPREKKPIVSDSLVREINRSVAVKENVSCPSGEVMVPELGICLPFNSSRGKHVPPSSSSLVKEPEKLEIVAFANSVSFADDCKPGLFFISELGICA